MRPSTRSWARPLVGSRTTVLYGDITRGSGPGLLGRCCDVFLLSWATPPLGTVVETTSSLMYPSSTAMLRSISRSMARASSSISASRSSSICWSRGDDDPLSGLSRLLLLVPAPASPCAAALCMSSPAAVSSLPPPPPPASPPPPPSHHRPTYLAHRRANRLLNRSLVTPSPHNPTAPSEDSPSPIMSPSFASPTPSSSDTMMPALNANPSSASSNGLLNSSSVMGLRKCANGSSSMSGRSWSRWVCARWREEDDEEEDEELVVVRDDDDDPDEEDCREVLCCLFPVVVDAARWKCTGASEGRWRVDMGGQEALRRRCVGRMKGVAGVNEAISIAFCVLLRFCVVFVFFVVLSYNVVVFLVDDAISFVSPSRLIVRWCPSSSPRTLCKVRY
ncbi:hypothetical protein IWZ00DRAFT_81301 [Phyllosticta capitalensis]|uniref:uncharacterized protein n=1 Tax=Phyllosticta capitalensis TaxID=121624 RepID=UPI003132775A